MDIIEWFIKEFPSLVQKMKACSYHYSSKVLNNHHLEGDVWTHTMMAFAHAQRTNQPVIIQWAILLHDLGRIYTRYENKEKGYLEFGDFEGVSCYTSLSVLNKAGLSMDEKVRILKIIAYHYTMIDHLKFDKPSLENLKKQFIYEEQLLHDLALYARCDLQGRHIAKSRKHLYDFDSMDKKIENILSLPFQKPKKSIKKPILYLLVGPPCSGKSTWIKNQKKSSQTIVINRDSCVMEIGAKYDKSNYDDAFDLMHDNKDVKKEIDQLDEARENIAKSTQTQDVIIDNPNLKTKNRKEWIDELTQTHHVKVILFLTSFESLRERNQERMQLHNKSISRRGVIKKLKTFFFPLYSEGIDEIEYITHP